MTCECSDKMKLGDWGTPIKIHIVECNPTTGLNEDVDVSGAISLQIKLKAPVAATVTKTALILNPPGTDGWIYYTTVGPTPLDINEVGWWKVEGVATWANGSWRSTTGTLEVVAAL